MTQTAGLNGPLVSNMVYRKCLYSGVDATAPLVKFKIVKQKENLIETPLGGTQLTVSFW